MEFLQRKKFIIEKLESSLASLKQLKPEYFSPFDNSKKLVSDSHTKLLQIFYLDRENEDLLVKLNQPIDRQSFNRFSVPPEQIDKIHKRSLLVINNQRIKLRFKFPIIHFSKGTSQCTCRFPLAGEIFIVSKD